MNPDIDWQTGQIAIHAEKERSLSALLRRMAPTTPADDPSDPSDHPPDDTTIAYIQGTNYIAIATSNRVQLDEGTSKGPEEYRKPRVGRLSRGKEHLMVIGGVSLGKITHATQFARNRPVENSSVKLVPETFHDYLDRFEKKASE